MKLSKPENKNIIPQETEYIDIEGCLKPCYGHRMCTVSYNRTFLEMDLLGDIDLGSVPSYIKNEGVYMFGGVFGERVGQRTLVRQIFFLPIGKRKSHRWK